MERIPVTSTSFTSIGYEPDSRILEVEFTRGAVFRYYDVPVEEYNALMAHDSIGRGFNAIIKNRYEFTQE
ncbi:KTSC domain-containing protein [Anatilimnocola floriformis]|uniref:KTSC domain-containing protein n=1 Tax=Anatilimnocola floriformis TaxID=2948575 RepID=UPI0020C3351A|nr:KTSC domain-containing protein [Anatilimnocola floriformis]